MGLSERYSLARGLASGLQGLETEMQRGGASRLSDQWVRSTLAAARTRCPAWALPGLGTLPLHGYLGHLRDSCSQGVSNCVASLRPGESAWQGKQSDAVHQAGAGDTDGAPTVGQFKESFEKAPNPKPGGACRGATGDGMGPCNCCHPGAWDKQKSCHQKQEGKVVWRRAQAAGRPRAEELGCGHPDFTAGLLPVPPRPKSPRSWGEGRVWLWSQWASLWAGSRMEL